MSLVTMVHTLGMFGQCLLSARLADNFGRARTIVGGAVLLGVSCVLAPLSQAASMAALSMFLRGIPWNHCHAAGAAPLTECLTLGEHGRVQGGSGLAMGLFAGFGSLQSGALFAWAGFAYVSALGLLIALLPLVLAIRHLARHIGQPSLASVSLGR